MWVFIEQIGDLYLGVAHDEDGRKLLEITEPVTESEIHALMEPLSGGDCYDFDCAIYEADERPDDGRTADRKFFHLLRVRAKAGLATESDAAWVVGQLRHPDSVHATIFLLWALGYMGPQYEQVVTPFLSHANTNGEAEYAMEALFQMGLLETYVDLSSNGCAGPCLPGLHSGTRCTAWPYTRFVRARIPRYSAHLLMPQMTKPRRGRHASTLVIAWLWQ